MISLVLSILSDPILLAIGGGIIATVVAFFKGRSSERSRARAKEADAYEKHLEDLTRAHDARNRVSDGVPEHDPYRRD